MKQELMDAIQEMPVIAAVKDDTGLCNALTNENIRVVFYYTGISATLPPSCGGSTRQGGLQWSMWT